MGSFSRLSSGFFLLVLLSACEGMTGITEKSFEIPDASTKFAAGTKAVRVNLSNRSAAATEPKGSFTLAQTTVAAPSSTLIPSGYPGYDGSSTYNPGVSATYYYDVDGSTAIAKPSWIKDIQVGFMDLPSGGNHCAMFGSNSSTPVPNFFQTSEYNCDGYSPGTGSGQDGIFIRVVLDRDQAYIGTKENLLIQLEYEATGLRLNPDNFGSNNVQVSSSTNPETYVDQLWKVYSGSSLAATATPVPFSMVIPPNHAYHCVGEQGGTYTTCTGTVSSVATVKQLVFPLASLSGAEYIQISRVRGGRVLSTGALDTGYYNGVCGVGSATNNPRCLGVVFRSLTLIRI